MDNTQPTGTKWAAATTDLHAARYIVSAGGAADGANYTTLASAYAAAASAGAPQTVFIQPGTYIENLTLIPGINISAYTCDPWRPNVSIVGKLSYSSAGIVAISGINLQTNSDYFLEVTGSVASQVFLKSCNLSIANNTGIHYVSSSSSSGIFVNDCRGDISTTGIAVFAQTAAGQLKFNYTIITNTGGSSTSSINSGSGNTGLFYSYIANPITTSSTALFGSQFSEMDSVAQNTAALTLNGTGANFIEFSKFGSGTAPAISIGSGVLANFHNCAVNSSNTNAITGTGTIIYSNLAFYGSSKINTSTQSGGTAYGGLSQNPSAGFIGEQITANANVSSLTNATPVNVTSISLTAGIWDVSGMADFYSVSGVTGNSFRLGISNTSNTMPGSGGLNQLSTPTPPTPNSDSGLTVCPQRKVLTSTTTYYLVCQANFTAGSVGIQGIIMATRVG